MGITACGQHQEAVLIPLLYTCDDQEDLVTGDEGCANGGERKDIDSVVSKNVSPKTVSQIVLAIATKSNTQGNRYLVKIEIHDSGSNTCDFYAIRQAAKDVVRYSGWTGMDTAYPPQVWDIDQSTKPPFPDGDQLPNSTPTRAATVSSADSTPIQAFMAHHGYGIKLKADRLVDDLTTASMNDTGLDQRIVGQRFLDAESTGSDDIDYIARWGSFYDDELASSGRCRNQVARSICTNIFLFPPTDFRFLVVPIPENYHFKGE